MHRLPPAPDHSPYGFCDLFGYKQSSEDGRDGREAMHQSVHGSLTVCCELLPFGDEFSVTAGERASKSASETCRFAASNHTPDREHD